MNVTRNSFVYSSLWGAYTPLSLLFLYLLCNLRLLGLGSLFLKNCIGPQWVLCLHIYIYVLILSLSILLECPFILVGYYFISSLYPFTLLFDAMIWWVQVFSVYPPLDLVHWFSSSTLVVHEFSSLMVMDSLLSVPLLEVHQVWFGVFRLCFDNFWKWCPMLWM